MRQEDHEFKVGLGYIARPCLKKQHNNNNKKQNKRKKHVSGLHSERCLKSNILVSHVPMASPSGELEQGKAG
jgi:hypothetical protein